MISFDNTEYAFEYKSDKDLRRADFLFSSMGKPLLLQAGLKLLPFAMKYHFPFTKTALKQTIFKQFVGGQTLEETAPVANNLGKYNVRVILDYGVEGGDDGEAGYDHSTEEFIKVIEYAATQRNIPLMSIKITGIVRFSLLEKIDRSMNTNESSLMKQYYKVVSELEEKEKDEWHRVVQRLIRICDVANARNIGVLIDAEETWIQDPVDALALLMMDTYNKEKVVVYNTIQLYRHDRLAFLKASKEAAVERGFVLGAKLVRGAYMEKERKRAELMCYASPIQPTKEACDNDYNDAVSFCIDHIGSIALIVASHNEYSNLYATKLMDKNNINHDHPHIHFSQLYGMSDNITFNLAKNGFSVSKYLPFGPIQDVVPYLMRRAQENSSVAGQTGRESGLIKKELKRRKDKA